MSTIRINWAAAAGVADALGEHRRSLKISALSLQQIRADRFLQGDAFQAMFRVMDRILEACDQEYTNLKNLENGLREVHQTYLRYEQAIAEGKTPEEVAKEETIAEWVGLLRDLIAESGVLGPLVSTILAPVTGWKDDTWVDMGQNILKSLGNLNVDFSGKTKADWVNELFGLEDVFNSVDGSSPGKAFASSIKNEFVYGTGIKQSSTVPVSKLSVACKWGGYFLSLVGSAYENCEEFKGQEGKEARIVTETIVETGVDIGMGAVATAGVTAAASGLITAGVITTAPAVAVGAASVIVVWGVNKVCEELTGQDVGEWVADGVCAIGEWGASLWNSWFD
ncbi:hypothetical protein ACTQ33_01880 [Candidatus Avoscillospira sp. LCP25S3_F1]|uniref:hypothetical protein n=1 Tax=Candidatus Avoscillospira sp. LCP25S3_F1 TaxID=3438825 RepID=UPI003F8DA59B